MDFFSRQSRADRIVESLLALLVIVGAVVALVSASSASSDAGDPFVTSPGATGERAEPPPEETVDNSPPEDPEGTGDLGDEESPAAIAESTPPSESPGPEGGQRDLDCGSGYIVVLTSSEGASPQATVQDALDRFPNAPDRHFLDPVNSCLNLSSLTNKVNLSLFPYMGTFASPVDACEARMDYLDTTTYVIGVDSGETTATYCACYYEDVALPILNSAVAGEPQGDYRFWALEVQYMLYDAGYNPDKLVSGKYGPATTEIVMSLQSDYGLSATGAMDPGSWQVLKSLVC